MAQITARALAPLTGLQAGVKDFMRLVGAGYDLTKQEGIAKAALKSYRELQAVDSAKIESHRPANTGVLGELIQVPFSVLKLTDMPFRTIGERAEAHIAAVDRAVKEGFGPSTQEFRERVTQYSNDPTLGLEGKDAVAALARISQAGDVATFQERLGAKTEGFQRLIAGSYWQLVFPAIKTPANLASWAIQHVPGLNFMSGRWREDYAAGGERKAQAVSRIVVGTAIAASAYMLADQGLITGAGMFEKEEGNVKRPAGWQPNSFLIGDKYYSYARLEPVAKVVGIAADLIELQKATKDDEDKAKIAAMLVMMFGNATISTTYMSGLANTMNAVLSPERYGDQLMEQYASALVPKVIGQTVTMNDPYKREVDGVLDAIQSQLPFLREKLLPKRDVWGEPTENGRWFGAMPIATTQVSENKVKTEAMRLHLAIADAPKFFMEQGPFKTKDERTKATPEMRDVFKEVSGTKAMAILGPIVASQDWERIPDFAKAAIYKDVIAGTRKEGTYAALPADSAERVQLREKIVAKILQQVQDAENKPQRRSGD